MERKFWAQRQPRTSSRRQNEYVSNGECCQVTRAKTSKLRDR